MSAPKYFRGEWLEPGERGYASAGSVFNLLHADVRPAVIARCLGNTDVIAALSYAREHGLPVAVRATGFSLAGFSATTGVTVDLSAMRSVRIDPSTRTAWVGGGVTGGDLAIEGHRYGLAGAVGALSSTGMGLVLGGGMGPLADRTGFASDSILAVEVVTASGEVVIASRDEEPELFWAIRGAGANFGVVTALKLQLHEVPETMAAGWVTWRPERMREALKNFRERAVSTSDDMHMLNVVGPEELQLWISHFGTESEAEAEVARLLKDCPPDEDHRSRMPFRDLLHLYDDDFPPQRTTMLEEAFPEVTDEMIDAVLDAIRAPLPAGSAAVRQIEVSVRRGALTAVPEVPSVVHPTSSDPVWAVLPGTWWQDPSEDELHRSWLQETLAAVRPAGTVGGRLVPSMVGVPSSQEVVERVYGDQLERLQALKRTWDPENVFGGNLTIEGTSS